MDIILVVIFAFIAVITPVFRKMEPAGRLIPFFGMLLDLVWLSILYKEYIGITFTSVGSAFVIPMNASGIGLPWAPEAAVLPIVFVFVDALACLAP